MWRERRTLLGPQVFQIDGLSLLDRGRVQLGSMGTGVVGTHTAERARKRAVANASALHGKCLAHNGAATSQDLEV